jgi:hypothetical protein
MKITKEQLAVVIDHSLIAHIEDSLHDVDFHLKMRHQLIEIIASNFPPLQGKGKGGMGSPSNFHPPL